VIFTLRFIVGAALTNSTIPEDVSLATLFSWFDWIAIVLSIYLINGASDVDEDVINASTRPISSGLLDSRTASSCALSLLVFSLTLNIALIQDVVHGALAACMVLVGWGYSVGPCPLKRSAVGVAFAAMSGGAFTYLAGAASTDGPILVGGLPVIFLLSLWLAVGGSTKDLGDWQGDRIAGRRTLPVVLGVRRAKSVLSVAALGLVFLAVYGWALGVLPPLVVGVFIAGASCGSWLTWRLDGSTDSEALRQPYKAFMVTQYVTNVAALVSAM
jgi:4-hydroxybenzoate polyprenyltransferase